MNIVLNYIRVPCVSIFTI